MVEFVENFDQILQVTLQWISLIYPSINSELQYFPRQAPRHLNF